MPWRPRDEARDAPRRTLELDLLPDLYAVCRLPTDAAVPAWAGDDGGTFVCVMRSRREAQGLTVICEESRVPAEGVEADRGWSAVRFVGAFDFGEVGVLASVIVPLGRARVPAMSVSTFETDYVLFKAERLDRVRAALEEAGHRFVS